MSNLYRLLSLALLTGSLAIIQQVTLNAEPCDTEEYITDCNAADNWAFDHCEEECWRQFQQHRDSYYGGTCHWWGEDDPGNCLNNYPDTCGCFKNYSYGTCNCTGI